MKGKNRAFVWKRKHLFWGLCLIVSMMLVNLSACNCGAPPPPLPDGVKTDGGGELVGPDIAPVDTPDVPPVCVNPGTTCQNDQQCNPSCTGATLRCFEGRCARETPPPDVPPDVPPAKCPNKCGSHDDCNTPDCGTRTQCINGTCGFIPPTCPSRCRSNEDCQTPDCGKRVLCERGRCNAPPECPQACFQDSDCQQVSCGPRTTCEQGKCIERAKNTPPVANAGPDAKGTVNQRVRLSGLGSSDADGDKLTYSWRFIKKPAGSLTDFDDGTSATPAFIPDKVGTYTIELIVNDGRDSSKPDTVTISVGQDATQQPRIVAISPTSIEEGYPTTQLVVFGQNFNATSVINLQGKALKAQLLNPTVLTTTLPAGLKVGTYPINVANGAQVSNSLNLQVTKPKPEPPILTRIAPGEVQAGTGFSMRAFGSKFVNGSRITIDGRAIPTIFVNSTQLATNVTAQSAGTYKIQIVNPDGTRSAAVLTLLVKTVKAGPVINTLTPSEGFTGQAITLQIAGIRFVNGATVTVGGKAYPVTFKSASSLEVKLSIATAGSYNVIVENPDGQKSNAASLLIKQALPAPVINAINPASVFEKTASSVGVLGANFVNGAKVTLNGTAYTTTFVNNSQLRVTLPNTLAVGTYQVQVTNPDGKKSNISTLTVRKAPPKPQLTALNPKRVPLGSSGNITATGANFVKGAQVQIGTRLVNATVTSPTQLTFQLPSGAQPGTFQVRVINPDNQSSNTLPLEIFRGPPPTLTSLQPNQGAAGAIVTVRMVGTNLVSGAKAFFQGGAQTTSFISATEVQMTLSLGSLSQGSYDVWVQNPDGQNSNKLKFTVTAPTGPQITQLLPANGQSNTSVSGIVDGAGFKSGATVQFNGKNLKTTFLSTSSLGITWDLNGATAGTFPVTVTNPDNKKSNIVYFTVTSKQAPKPILTTVNPTDIKIGSNNPIYLLGQHFQNGAVMMIQLPFVGGFGMPANFINATTLVVRAQFPRIPFPFPAQRTSVFVRNPDRQESNKKPVTIRP